MNLFVYNLDVSYPSSSKSCLVPLVPVPVPVPCLNSLYAPEKVGGVRKMWGRATSASNPMHGRKVQHLYRISVHT